MLDRLNAKLKNIDAKLSNPSTLQDSEIVIGVPTNTTTIPRHTKLKLENISAPITQLIDDMNNLENLMVDLNKLQVKFYNNREVQMGLLKDRVEVLHLRKNLLSALDTGIRNGIICLNDKKMLKPGPSYEIDGSGISFPLLQQTKIIPAAVVISRDSNVRLGTVVDPVMNSQINAIHTESHNDTFSVNRSDNEDIFLSFTSKFNRLEIINEVDFVWIEKLGQLISITIKDALSGKILYSKTGAESKIKLDLPVETNEIIVEITAKAIQVNQLDIKELSMYKRKYKDTLKVETIALPSFSNKYLTLEDVKYKVEHHKEFLDTIVRIKDFKLNSLASEEQIAGPYKDPSFIIESKIKNKSSILNYLQKPSYSMAKIQPVGNDYKTFLELASAQEFSLTQEKQNSNSIYLSLPVSGMECFIDISVDGISYTRRLSSEALANKEYFIQYTGTGYVLTFKSLEWKSIVTCKVTSMPSYIDKEKIFFPYAGLGSQIFMSYAKDIKKKKVPIILFDGNVLDLKVKNIQRVAFIDKNGVEAAGYSEKRISETLNENDYAIDYKSGLLYLGSGISGLVQVTYLAFNKTNSVINLESKEMPCPSDIEVFEYSGSLDSLSAASSELNNNFIFGYQKYNRILTKVDKVLGLIQLPSFMCLHKGSVGLKNSTKSKKEVEYIDGVTELHKKEIEFDFYDYVETKPSYHVYRLRTEALPLAYDKCNIVFENSLMIQRKSDTTAPELVSFNEGDYALNAETESSLPGIFLYIKNAGFPIVPAPTIKAKIEKDISDDVFSVNYITNIIYSKSLDNFAGDIKFKYSSLSLNQFSLALEVGNDEIKSGNIYYSYINNLKTAERLLSYFSPTFESISIGIIG
ncbi:MAG: hypothetical protein EB127_02170 [Alphaproteobacteria bacterium]|nr:hypothetical protein [Alphaproteobacteria bacterium]